MIDFALLALTRIVAGWQGLDDPSGVVRDYLLPEPDQAAAVDTQGSAVSDVSGGPGLDGGEGLARPEVGNGAGDDAESNGESRDAAASDPAGASAAARGRGEGGGGEVGADFGDVDDEPQTLHHGDCGVTEAAGRELENGVGGGGDGGADGEAEYESDFASDGGGRLQGAGAGGGEVVSGDVYDGESQGGEGEGGSEAYSSFSDGSGG